MRVFLPELKDYFYLGTYDWGEYDFREMWQNSLKDYKLYYRITDLPYLLLLKENL